MKGLGFDPQWSIDAATRWCARSEWVYWDTTPFNAIFRDAGSILGKCLNHERSGVWSSVVYRRGHLLVCQVRVGLLGYHTFQYAIFRDAGSILGKCLSHVRTNEPQHDKTNKMTCVSPQSDQSSLCAQWVAKDQSFLVADSEDSNQTRRIPRLIRVFAGHTGQ